MAVPPPVEVPEGGAAALVFGMGELLRDFLLLVGGGHLRLSQQHPYPSHPCPHSALRAGGQETQS